MTKTSVLLCTLLLTIIRPAPCQAYPGGDPFDLLIVSPNEFRPVLEVLKEHKNAIGMSTDIITLEEIPFHFSGADRAEEIKKAIAYFEAENGVKYVMLVGDMDVLPVRWVAHAETNAPDSHDYYYPSDLYYADLYDGSGVFSDWNADADDYYGEHLVSGDCAANPFSVNVDQADFHPDVAVGRVPASTLAEVESYVAKIIRYEHLTASDPDDWFHNMTLLAAGGRLCDPGIHFNNIQDFLPAAFSYESYIDQSYYLPHADHPERPCDCDVGESLEDCMARTGLSSDEIGIFQNIDDYFANRPNATLENIGFLAYHDHTMSMRGSNYRTVIDNTNRFTITYSDGCSDGGFAGGPPGEMARFAPTGRAGGQDLLYREVDGNTLNVTFVDYYFDTDGDGDDEKYYEITDCVINGISVGLNSSGDHCGGGFFPDMSFVDDFDAGGSIVSRTRPYILNAPPPHIQQPPTADREFHPEDKLFAKNNATSEETGWIGLVAATKGASFPTNGELESLFFKGYSAPHATVAGRNRLGDMWRSMEEYWLAEIFDGAGNFSLTPFLDKYDMDRSAWFNKYCSRSLEHAMMVNLFGDPSLRVGGVSGISDTEPPVTSCPDGVILGGSGSVTIPFIVTDGGSPPSGVRTTRYRINGGSWQAGTTPTILLDPDSTTDGYYTLAYSSEDFVGNVETEKESTIGIDTYPPRTSILVNGSSPAFVFCACLVDGDDCECPEQGCYTDKVEVELSAVDNPAPVEPPDEVPTEAWNNLIGGAASDQFSAVREITGGYILAGYSTDSAGGYDLWLMKTDEDGTPLWPHLTFGGSEFDKGYAVLPAADGGFYVAGQTSSFGAGGSDGWLIKTDSDGTLLWQQTYGGSDSDVIYAMEETTGGLILAGYTESPATGSYRDMWLIKTDTDGDLLWQQHYGGVSGEEASDLATTSDGGYILVGKTTTYGAGRADLWLVKTDASGTMEWERTFGGADEDHGYSVEQTADGGYIIAGWTKSEGMGSLDGWLIKTDDSGSEEWRRTFGRSYLDLFTSVRQTFDGGYIITGKMSTSSYVSYNLWLVKTDGDGAEEWSLTFGGAAVDEGQEVIQKWDGSYVVAGRTESDTAGDSDGWLIKVDVGGPAAVIPASGVARTDYYSTAWDWMYIPSQYTGPDMIGHGNHTLRYRSEDMAGNQEGYRETSFCVIDLDDATGIIKEEIRILAALKEIVAMRMRKELADTLPIDYVDFEYLDEEGQWVLFARDTVGSDGWQQALDTTALANGLHTLRMSAFMGEPPKDLSLMAAQAESALLHQEEQTVMVSNVDDSSYLFELSAPSHADRGETVDYLFTFTNKGDISLYDLDLVCDLDPAFFEKLTVADGGTVNSDGLPSWYVKEIKSGETVQLSFSGTTRDTIVPATLITAQGTLSFKDAKGLEVPQVLSDDPQTARPGDYTGVRINPVSATISGRVIDFMSGEAVSAYVSTGMQGSYDITDENGSYALPDLPPGSYVLTVGSNSHVYHEPDGPVAVELDGSGRNRVIDFAMARPDRLAPVSRLDLTVDEIIAGQLNLITGTASDYQPGSGVSRVEIMIANNSAGLYWDGASWTPAETWLPADGTEEWRYFGSGLTWQAGDAYTIGSRAFDYSDNGETPQPQSSLVSLQPPDLLWPPDGSTFEGAPHFSWSHVHDCTYAVQLDDNLDFSSPALEGTHFFEPSLLPANLEEGTYYWRVKAADRLTGIPESDWSTIRKVSITTPTSPCTGDLDGDGDVDGRDISILAKNPNLPGLADFALEFGSTDCSVGK